MSLPDSLERAASELDEALADLIRPANGDPHRLLDDLAEPEAREVLSWMLRHEPEAAVELVEAWDEDRKGAQVLLGISEQGLSKPGRKLLRKAHHRLRSRGLEVPEAEVGPVPTSAPKRRTAEEDRWQAAYVSPPDFRGARLAYLVESHPAGGARLFEARLEPGRGLHDFKVYNAARNKVRGFLRSLSGGSEERLIAVDGLALRALIRRTALDQPADRPLPTAFVEWRMRLFSDELEKQPTPGELVRADLGEDPDREAALAKVATDLHAGRLGPWPPSTTWVGEWMERGRGAADGPDGSQRETAIGTWLDEASEALTTRSDPSVIARHLEELAWVHAQAGREDEARRLLAAATAVTQDADALRKLSRARVEALFAPFLTELRAAEDEAKPRDAVERSG